MDLHKLYEPEEIDVKAERVIKIAEDFIRLCKKIGGKSRAKRVFGGLEVVCYLDKDTKIKELDLNATSSRGTRFEVSTNKGYSIDDVYIPKDMRIEFKAVGVPIHAKMWYEQGKGKEAESLHIYTMEDEGIADARVIRTWISYEGIVWIELE